MAAKKRKRRRTRKTGTKRTGPKATRKKRRRKASVSAAPRRRVKRRRVVKRRRARRAVASAPRRLKRRRRAAGALRRKANRIHVANPRRKKASRSKRKRNPGIPDWAKAGIAAVIGLGSYALATEGAFALTQRLDPTRDTLLRNRYLISAAAVLGGVALATKHPVYGAGLAAGGLASLAGSELVSVLGKFLDAKKSDGSLAGVFGNQGQMLGVFGNQGQMLGVFDGSRQMLGVDDGGGYGDGDGYDGY